MSDLTLNGFPVVSGTLELFRTGPWIADLVVEAPSADGLVGAVTLARADGAGSWRGCAQRARLTAAGRVEMRVWGGPGGAFALGTQIAPRFYSQAPARLVLGDAAREAGEALAAAIDPALVAQVLGSWARRGGALAATLDLVARELGATWRVLADGTVWLGVDAWAVADVDHTLVSEDPATSSVVVATGAPDPALVPGATFRGSKVGYVAHQFDGDRTRTTVVFGANVDPRAVASRTVRGKFPELPFSAPHLARVVQQSADGTLHCVLQDPAMPGLVGVELRLPLPGATVRLPDPVPADTWVIVEFEGGSPARPYAALWRAGAAALGDLTITNANGATIHAETDGSVELRVGSGARITLTAGGDIEIIPAPTGKVKLGTTNPADLAPIALGGDAVAGAAVTPVASRNVQGPVL